MFHHSITDDEVAPPQPQPLAEAAGLLRGMVGLPGLLLPAVPRGDGGVVRVLPGYLTGDLSTVALRGYLRGLGYRARGWGLGRNRGDVDHYVQLMTAEVRRDAEATGQRVRVVGWSLGGVIARETARRAPDAVSHVVTLGSPIVGGPKYTLAASSYASNGWDLDRIAASVAQRNAEPMPVPVTALYSRQDSVVAWQACLDPNPLSPTRHVEVRGMHAELGFSSSVLRLVGRALAEGR